MKRTVYNMMMGCMTAFFLAACINESDTLPCTTTETNGNSIILDISSPSPAQPASRAEATGSEAAISHIDVLIFKADASEAKVYHERVTVSGGNTPEAIALTKSREEFAENQAYKVYLIANSKHEAARFNALADLNALKAMTQEDRNIHLTGLDLNDVPQTFLMDGIAHRKGEIATDVVLNDNGQTDDTILEVVLRRAAAKIEVRISKGEKVTFGATMPPGAGYYLRNMPYTTSVISGVDAEAQLYTPTIATPRYFQWGSNEITVTAYVYAHSWADESAFEKDVRLVVNLPLSYKESEDAEETVRESNYYQVPVVDQSKRLERNTYYVVTATVNAPGATNPSEATTLEGIRYSVENWAEETINVGGEEDRPIFLYVNKDEMAMYNMTDDNTTLHFSSSSAVSAKVQRAYYINKFGQETNVANDILNQITITPAEGLSGNIAVHSPVPTNNAVRYIVVNVTNEDGATPSTVTIAQYPLEYITNIQSWYSYRDDFGGTNYENKGNNRYVIATGYNNGTWQYYTNSSIFRTDFFRSKYVSSESNGRSTIRYYRWTQNGNSPTDYETSNSLDNARMYHVQITASSGDYTLGIPRITNGKTDPGSDNAKLVSPSFMIASQLGAVMAANSVEMAASHCEQYVEVYKNKSGKTVHLRDWRLPTEAELKIIMEFQYRENAAMDEVLSGRRYWSASGLVKNTQKPNDTDQAIRCIRDAYDGNTVNQ